jgi:hypothetical protein
VTNVQQLGAILAAADPGKLKKFSDVVNHKGFLGFLSRIPGMTGLMLKDLRGDIRKLKETVPSHGGEHLSDELIESISELAASGFQDLKPLLTAGIGCKGAEAQRTPQIVAEEIKSEAETYAFSFKGRSFSGAGEGLPPY